MLNATPILQVILKMKSTAKLEISLSLLDYYQVGM